MVNTKFVTTRPVMTSALFVGLAIYGGVYSAVNVAKHPVAIVMSSVSATHR